jgi:hypothetical protein
MYRRPVVSEDESTKLDGTPPPAASSTLACCKELHDGPVCRPEVLELVPSAIGECEAGADALVVSLPNR